MGLQLAANVRGLDMLRGIETQMKTAAVRQAEDLERVRQKIEEEIRAGATRQAEEANRARQRIEDEIKAAEARQSEHLRQIQELQIRGMHSA